MRNDNDRGRGVVLRILAHASIAGGLTLWIDMARGWAFNADQLVGLTAMLAGGCLIIDAAARRFVSRQSQRRPVDIDVRSFFEEV